MNQRPIKGWLKHWDFILLDLLCLQAAFLLAHALLLHDGNPYAIPNYRYLIVILTVSHCLTIILVNHYNGSTRRGYLEELYSVLRSAGATLIVALLLMFGFHTTFVVSRLLTGWTLVAYVFLDYIARVLNKRRVVRRSPETLKRSGRALVVIAPGSRMEEAVTRLTAPGVFRDYFIAGCFVTDGAAVGAHFDVPVEAFDEVRTVEKLRRDWVDDAFILQCGAPVGRDLVETLIDMGITVHVSTELLSDELWSNAEISAMGSYRVLTKGMKSVSVL